MHCRFAAIVLAGSALFGFFPGVAPAADKPVTFQGDVLPILAKNCQSCHSPGKVAPMSFLTYKSTRPWAAKIKQLVAEQKMPPVVGTAHYAVLTQGEGLSAAEIATLVKWVDAGAPQGKARAVKPKK